MNRTVPVYDSARRGPRAWEELVELLRYRNLVQQTIRRNIVVRYKRSVLGVAWTMLNPLATAIILTIVFSRVFGGGASYATYVLSGILAWNFFSQGTSDAMANVLWGGSLLRRIYIPRTTFAVASIGTGLVNLALAIVPLVFIMLVTGVPVRPAMLILPVPAIFLAMFAMGIGLMISTFVLYFPDVAEMYGILLMAWFYLSPIIWSENMLPPQYLWIVHLNPMYYLITCWRMPIYDGVLPGWDLLLISGGCALVTLVAGWLFFSWKSDEFAYRV